MVEETNNQSESADTPTRRRRTFMPRRASTGLGSVPVVEPDEVAEAVVDGLRRERFLILPHPEVADYFRRKADDYDRWLAGMRRLQAAIVAG